MLHNFCRSFTTYVVKPKNYLKYSTKTIQYSAKSKMEDLNRPKFGLKLTEKVVPVNYKLVLNPDMKQGSFQGSVEILVNVKENTNNLILNTKSLDIRQVRVVKDGNQVPVVKFTESKDMEQLCIELDMNLVPGDYSVAIDYNGALTGKIVGFYASQFKDRTMVASKFQPTYARQAFPCFDEPDFKATYDITLVKPADYIALSNMNEISSVRNTENNTDSVTFATSVPMSTYLACFVICDFDHKEAVINSFGVGHNFTLRTFAQKGETHKIDFALDIGKRATEYYIKYYQVPFPLPKLDMIAIPDYVSGATEHWGLITYRETSFLVDETKSSVKNKISVANVIAHELAHMWFGNLVTMKWWDEVWLNEGFASYMQVKVLNAIEPSWTMLDQFLTNTLHNVLVTDAKLSSHAIVQTVETPDQITAIFDAISYSKGSSVLRMLEGFVGEQNFRSGVTDYLKKHEFGNTITQDLLKALEPYFEPTNSDLSLTHIMDTWTRQMGYPVINVELDPTRPGVHVLKQSRFLLDPEAQSPDDSPYGYKWDIPVTYKTYKDTHDGILWFPVNASSVNITLGSDDKWLKVNNDQVGYYRVNYTPEMWAQLIDALKSRNEQLTKSDRAHLINDAFALADARALAYDVALNLTGYLPIEQDYVPWTAAVAEFNKLSKRLKRSNAHGDLLKYVQHVLTPVYSKQSWEPSNYTVIEGLLRVSILSAATKFELADAQTKVRDMFLRWLYSYGTDNAVTIEPDLRDVVYYYGMKSATEEEWERLWQIYLKEKDVQELTKLRHALAASDNVNILKRFLTLAWDEKNIRSQDYLTVLIQISHTKSGAEVIWDHVRNNWAQLVGRYTLNSRILGGMIPAITNSFDTDAQLQEMQAFFAKYPDAGAGVTGRRHALETVQNNIKWMKHNEPTVAKWLEEHTG